MAHIQGRTVTMRPMPKYQFDVEVLPEYLPEQSAPDTGVFSFAYTITITNKANTVTAKGKVRLTAGCAKNSDHMPCATVCSGVSIPAGNAV